MTAGCTKQGYADLHTASSVAEARSLASGDDIRAYVCKDCGWAHLTNKTKRARKDRDRNSRGRKQR